MDITKIVSAGGMVNIQELLGTHKKLMRTINNIRMTLGKQSDLLDNYILGVLTAINKISVLDAVDEGFQEASMELRELCAGIRDGAENVVLHPFYPMLKEYMDKHPCPNVGIYVDYYCAGVSIEYAEFALNRYLENRKMQLQEKMKEAQVDILKGRLMELVDHAVLVRLCDLLCQRFFVSSPSKVFIQCMADQYVLNCLTQNGNSRHVLQYILADETEE